ncbi:hypothetical protein K431DRAFT_112438 [Polychaeton citri CBS 116435]|uniref:Uncharacterized protein n=1 Tax=Polychaeton citri CBS 116435 TaxID=1314669 RepID=A0A9P4Q4F7_9PEZI|nr:hypothetical protein K431DRAFT_112438 [Polychaeton citri CBS 116435]
MLRHGATKSRGCTGANYQSSRSAVCSVLRTQVARVREACQKGTAPHRTGGGPAGRSHESHPCLAPDRKCRLFNLSRTGVPAMPLARFSSQGRPRNSVLCRWSLIAFPREVWFYFLIASILGQIAIALCIAAARFLRLLVLKSRNSIWHMSCVCCMRIWRWSLELILTTIVNFAGIWAIELGLRSYVCTRCCDRTNSTAIIGLLCAGKRKALTSMTSGPGGEKTVSCNICDYPRYWLPMLL